MLKLFFIFTLIFPLSFNLRANQTPPQVKKDYAYREYLEKVLSVVDKVIGGNLSVDVASQLGILNLSFWEGFGLGAGYTFGTMRQNEMYVRMDEFRINAGLSPGNIIQLPVFFNVSKEQKIRSYRLFKTLQEVYTAPLLKSIQLPFSADTAINEFDEGHRVSFPASLNLKLGLSNSLYPSLLKLQGVTDLYLSGMFNISVIKMPEEKVRVQIVAMNRAGFEASADFKIDVTLVGISIINDKILSWVDLDLAHLGVNANRNEAFMVDYLFDLKTADGRAQYDLLWQKNTLVEDIKHFVPRLDCQNIDQCLVWEVNLIDQFCDSEKNANKAVQRLNKARVIKKTLNGNAKVGIILAQAEGGGEISSSEVEMVDEHNQSNYYLHPVFSLNRQFSYLFNQFKSKKSYNTGVLYNTDPDYISTEFNNFITSFSREDSFLRTGEIDSLKIHLLKNLPLKVYGKIPWGKEWTNTLDRKIFSLLANEGSGIKMNLGLNSKKLNQDILMEDKELPEEGDEKLFGGLWKRNVQLSYQISLSERAVAELSDLKESEFSIQVIDFMSKLAQKGLAPNDHYSEEEFLEFFRELSHLFDLRATRIHAPFNVVQFTLAQAREWKKMSGLYNLCRSAIFRDLGMGLLMHMAGEEKLEGEMDFKVHLEAQGLPKIDYLHGNQQTLKLRDTLEQVYQLMNF